MKIKETLPVEYINVKFSREALEGMIDLWNNNKVKNSYGNILKIEIDYFQEQDSTGAVLTATEHPDKDYKAGCSRCRVVK